MNMSSKDYYPKSEGDVMPWLENFNKKLPSYAATLGIPSTTVTQMQTESTDAGQKIKDAAAAKNTWQSAVSAKTDALAQVEKHVRDQVVVFKRNANYTEAIGLDLGVIGPSQTQISDDVLNNAKPDFTATVLPDAVRLDWTKGLFDGVVVHCKRGAETAFTMLDKDTISPYEDDRQNVTKDVPETRIYRMRYLYGDDEVGV